MITPRATRLVRAPDLCSFRQAIVDLACSGSSLDARNRLVVVPTRAAAACLIRTIEDRRLRADAALVLPELITRDGLAARFGERLAGYPALLTDSEREVLAGVASRMAVQDGHEPPFRLRPGLIAEIVGFYDALQRHLKDVDAFERLALGALEPGAADDRGAARLVLQTRFLVSTFRHLERLVEATGRADEHTLRARLLTEPAARPWRHVVLAVGDYASDRHGLMPAHWDFLARVPGLEQLDVVATDGMVAGAFHERIHQLLPGIEEIRVAADPERGSPILLVAQGGAVTHTARDREEEVIGFARWVRHEVRRREPDALTDLNRIALVVHRPLPYVYLAREVMRSAGIDLQMFDALPLASEPYAAALDLVMAFVAGNFARGPAIALLRSPHFSFAPDSNPLTARETAALDRALSEAGYLGDLATLRNLVSRWEDGPDSSVRPAVRRAAMVLLEAAQSLASLRQPARCDIHLATLRAFMIEHESDPVADRTLRSRHLRARAAVFEAMTSLQRAYAQFDSREVDFDETAAVLRRWVDAHTFAPKSGESGVHLVDAASARFGEFEAVQLAGLVDGEWPDVPHRNIFYSPGLLRELGWPAEADRLDGMRASFTDLVRLPSSRLVVSSFALEDDAVVAASALVDALPAAGLGTCEITASSTRIFEHEALGLDPVETAHLPSMTRASASRRIDAGRASRPGSTAAHAMPAFSLSALERYQDCPFKFFAADVLKLEEPPEDEPMLSPRARGRFVHEVFQRFFEAWGARGRHAIDVDHIDEARALFQEVAEPLLARFSRAEAGLERARLFGSAASIGVVDVVLGLEAARDTPVRERWLEYRFEGEFSLGAPGGWTVPIRGVADRVDLLDGNRLRVIDYKSGYAPQPKRALQAPIYALCAQEHLAGRDRYAWQIDEASYVAFAGKRALVQIVRPGADCTDVLAAARDRVIDIVDGIRRGDFSPKPYELRICSYCAYPSVCRKDYVGDE